MPSFGRCELPGFCYGRRRSTTIAVMAERILPGTALTDPAVMAQFVADCRRRWSTTDDRVAGTLWWYSTSSVVLTVLLTRLAEIDLAADPALDRLRVHVGEEGRGVNVYPRGVVGFQEGV